MKNALILGGSGALGKSLVQAFKSSKPIWKVINIDMFSNKEADMNYEIKKNLDASEIKEIKNKIKSNLDCIISVAGGWEGVSLDDENVIQSLNIMMERNLNSSILAALLAKKYLTSQGLLVFTGANAVKAGYNPGMLSYHLAKQSVHHLTELLAETEQLPKTSKIITILPTTIDTPSNRVAMKDADFSTWTKPEDIAALIKKWADSGKYPSERFYKV